MVNRFIVPVLAFKWIVRPSLLSPCAARVAGACSVNLCRDWVAAASVAGVSGPLDAAPCPAALFRISESSLSCCPLLLCSVLSLGVLIALLLLTLSVCCILSEPAALFGGGIAMPGDASLWPSSPAFAGSSTGERLDVEVEQVARDDVRHAHQATPKYTMYTSTRGSSRRRSTGATLPRALHTIYTLDVTSSRR